MDSTSNIGGSRYSVEDVVLRTIVRNAVPTLGWFVKEQTRPILDGCKSSCVGCAAPSTLPDGRLIGATTVRSAGSSNCPLGATTRELA